MLYARKNFSFNPQTKVAAMAASLSGLYYLLLRFVETEAVPGSIAFGFGDHVMEFPITLLASYLAGLFTYGILHEHLYFLRRKPYQWRIHPTIQTFGIALLVTTAVFFGGDYLMSMRIEPNSTVASLFLGSLYIDFLFAFTSGLVIFLVVFEAIVDLERQAYR